MTDTARIQPPNYTQIPNIIFDLMADKSAGLTEAELRVILAVARKTFGWHKKRDKISLSQLEKLTAMSRTSVVAGLEAATKRGLIRRTPDADDKRGGFFYELIVDEPNDTTSPKSGLVQNLNQSNNLTRTSTNSELELVQNLNTQKKDKERKERERGTPARTPAVQVYFDAYPNETLSSQQVTAISSTVSDLDRWRQALNDWALNGWNPKSIGKMLDRYRSGRTMQDERPASSNGHKPAERRPALPPFKPAADKPDQQASIKALGEAARQRLKWKDE